MKVRLHSTNEASSRPALLLPQIQAVFLVVAPCPRGASLVSVRRRTSTTGCWSAFRSCVANGRAAVFLLKSALVARSLDCRVGLTNNDGMRRTLTAVGLSLVIPLGSLSVPLVHAHPDELRSDHHHANEIHAHLGGHASFHASHDSVASDNVASDSVASDGVASTGATLDDHDAERTVSLQLFVAVAQASFDVPAAVVTDWFVNSPAEAAAHHPVRVVHGHDPPFVASTGSRAPPAFPS